MRGHSNSVIRALLLHCQALYTASISSSRSLQTLISPLNKISSPNPSPPSKSFSTVAAAKSHFSTPLLQSFQRRMLCSASGSSKYFLVNSEAEFNNAMKDIEEKSLPAVLYFTAAWCSPCKFISGVLEELIVKEYPHVIVYKIDIDKEDLEVTLRTLDIIAVPTLHFYQKGKKGAVVTGADVSGLKKAMKSLYREHE